MVDNCQPSCYFEMTKRKQYPNTLCPKYDLAVIRAKIAAGQVKVNPDVRLDALRDFGWGLAEILAVFEKLRPGHFDKTDILRGNFLVMIDVYKAHLNGEDVYIHFYINDDDYLVINSFHKLEKGG